MTLFVALMVVALATTALNAKPGAAQPTAAKRRPSGAPFSAKGHLKNHFITLDDFSDFTEEDATAEGAKSAMPDASVWVSPPLKAPLAWDELIVSWNAQLPPGGFLKIEARGVYPDRATKFYTLAVWSPDAALHPRHSVKGQKDSDGDVETDTLTLKRRGAQVQLRLTLGGALSDEALPGGETNASAAEALKALKFVGLTFLDSEAKAAPRPANRAAWGKSLPVPQRFQYDYEGERKGVWCSPTSTSMMLAHWAATLKRPELDKGVLEIAQGVHDPSWGGTGNWPFNTAFAGAVPGVRAYVTRFDDLTEVEEWIAAGFPVVLSVSYELLKGKPQHKGSGHLVVCVGFTPKGDVMFNDPAFRMPAGERKVYPRADVIAGWGHSKNTVYLIYPEGAAVPPNRRGHWENAAPAKPKKTREKESAR